MKKYLTALVLAIIIVPQVALASWWNPFSWSVFHSTNTQSQSSEEIVVDSSVNNLATTSSSTVVRNQEAVKSSSAWWNPFSWGSSNTRDTQNEKQTASTNVARSSSVPASSSGEKILDDTEKQRLQAENDKLRADVAAAKQANMQAENDKLKAENAANKLKLEKASSQVVSIPVELKKETKTYTLPNGAIVDIDGNILQPAPVNEQVVAKPTVDNKAVGIDYFLSKKTCIGLSGNQYSYCVDYAFNSVTPTTATSRSSQSPQSVNSASQTDASAYLVKQEKLNAINLEIANLNAQYVQDIKNVDINNFGRGVTTAISNGQKAAISRKYGIDYATLQAEYQQVLYSN